MRQEWTLDILAAPSNRPAGRACRRLIRSRLIRSRPLCFTAGPEICAMAEAAPLISVIVPVYNVAAHVGACIASLRAQSLADFEAIVVDDGSTDDSLAAARAAARGDGRFRFLRRPNGGLSAARNTGLDAARGRFIAFLDSDDRLAPGYLARLHGALAAQGGDWIACAIRFLYPDGGTGLHSAIHGAPALPAHPTGAPERHDITDWAALIRQFPSAWNKLYRRDLIGDIRFDEGTYYEDHAFFWRLACRTDHLLYLPEPLYWHLRGRPGQITRDAGERVFDQFAVLDTLGGILDTAPEGRRNGRLGLERLATRLICERAEVLRDPDRRMRFARAGRDWFARHGLRWSRDWDPTLAPGWDLAMAGETAFSIVIPSTGDAALLQVSLAALEAQTQPDYEVLVVPDGAEAAARLAPLLAGRAAMRLLDPVQETGDDPGLRAEVAVAAARNAGLAAAAGRFTLFLDAGDGLLPDALAVWLDAMLRHGPQDPALPGGSPGADLGVARFRFGAATGALHGGWHDPRGHEPLADATGPLPCDPALALRLHAHPSAKLFRTAFLRAAGLAFRPGPLSSWQFLAQAMAAAGSALHLARAQAVINETPEARLFWTAPVAAPRLAAAVADLGRALAGQEAALPPGWQGRLFARAVWEKLYFASHGPAQEAAGFALAAQQVARDSGLIPGSEADPYLGPRLLSLLAPASPGD